MLEPVGWVARRRTAGDLGDKVTRGGAKEIEVPTLTKRSLLNKGMGQVGTTRKEWVRGTLLEIQ